MWYYLIIVNHQNINICDYLVVLQKETVTFSPHGGKTEKCNHKSKGSHIISVHGLKPKCMHPINKAIGKLRVMDHSYLQFEEDMILNQALKICIMMNKSCAALLTATHPSLPRDPPSLPNASFISPLQLAQLHSEALSLLPFKHTCLFCC